MFDGNPLNANPEFFDQVNNSTTAQNLVAIYEDIELDYPLKFYPFVADSSYDAFHPYVASNEITGENIFYIPVERFGRTTSLEEDAIYYMPAFMTAFYAEKYGAIFAKDYFSETMTLEEKKELRPYMRFPDYLREIWALDLLYGFEKSSWDNCLELMPYLIDGLVHTNSETNMDDKNFNWGVYMQICIYLVSKNRFERDFDEIARVFSTLRAFKDPRVGDQFSYYFKALLKTQPLDEREGIDYNRAVLQAEFNRLLTAGKCPKQIKLVRETHLNFGEGHASRYAWGLK